MEVRLTALSQVAQADWAATKTKERPPGRATRAPILIGSYLFSASWASRQLPKRVETASTECKTAIFTGLRHGFIDLIATITLKRLIAKRSSNSPVDFFRLRNGVCSNYCKSTMP
jgi:hypothetical protein